MAPGSLHKIKVERGGGRLFMILLRMLVTGRGGKPEWGHWGRGQEGLVNNERSRKPRPWAQRESCQPAHPLPPPPLAHCERNRKSSGSGPLFGSGMPKAPLSGGEGGVVVVVVVVGRESVCVWGAVPFGGPFLRGGKLTAIHWFQAVSGERSRPSHTESFLNTGNCLELSFSAVLNFPLSHHFPKSLLNFPS